MAIKLIPIDPKYITSEFVSDGSKTTMRITIDKAGIPESAKKINFVYWYTTNNTTPEEPQEPDVEQPKPGTVKSVAIDIPIDSNTTYPITGEFELDGTPASVDAVANKTATYDKFETADYFYGLRPDFQGINSDPDSQLELIQGDFAPYQGGIALRGTKVADPVVGGE